MSRKTVYHTTALGNGKLIEKNGWTVDRSGVNIFGRGIYFWEFKEDAHSYGIQRYGKNNYDIVAEDIPINRNNSEIWDYYKARNSHIDQIALSLKARGVNVLIIKNPVIESATMPKAKGKAYVWLVDIRKNLEIVK